MLIPRALSAVDGAADRAKDALKRRFSLWENVRAEPLAAWGTAREVRFLGRVLDGATAGEAPSRLASARLALRRLQSDGVPRAKVRITLAGQRIEAEADGEGYYDAVMDLEAPLAGGPWFAAETRVLDPVYSPPAPTPVLLPLPTAALGVIVDVDALGWRGSSAGRLQRRRSADTREALPGAGALLRSLAACAPAASGAGGRRAEPGPNPLFYVSKSPWTSRGGLAGALEAHGAPRGVLLLGGFGVAPGALPRTGHDERALAWLATVLGTYPALPFVIVGGREDAGTYQEAVRRHPGRVRATLLRGTNDPRRGPDDRALERIVRDVGARGVPTRPFRTAAQAAEAAAALGLATPEAVGAVARGG